MKKNLTTKQKIRKYRAIQYSTFAGEYLLIASPYVGLGIVNWDKWFMNNPEAWKIGLGGTLAMVLVSIATLLVSKQKENKNLTSGYVALILGWYLIGLVFQLLGMIILEIAELMFISGLGLIGAFGLDIGSNSAKRKKLRAIEARTDAIKELDKEQAREEEIKEREKKVKF